ncbi:class I SAM-dependent methyltransferase [Paenibacillus albicereus]|uniref:Class I SAM-dependent methyltransferase n=1 Tax=Paenibacillus albicereus TaxID=2726185 RepID=A0A6H2H1W8_9BACL|nr:class I SAM-dependent methyltransferase [Paenibacillus albicereus]QJC53681.1 class I SAM-dependent methyltransferase [Paenibacillus albicereus]
MIPLVYDQLNRWGEDDDFFLALLEKAEVRELADLGCGTGRLTTHFAEAGYRVTGIDPHEKAIEQARKKDGSITWMLGDSALLQPGRFDAVIMTANVAQVFLTDSSWQRVVSDAYRSLKPGGHFIFDARNPKAKAWEKWEADRSPDRATDPRNGDPLEIWTDGEGFADNVYTFYETVMNARTGEVLHQEQMKLIFRTYEEILASLRQAGFSAIQAYGDWTFEPATEASRSFVFHGRS